MAVELRLTEKYCRIKAPFNKEFVKFIKTQGGRWDGRSRVWVTALSPEGTPDREEQIERIQKFCLKTYGDNGAERKHCHVVQIDMNKVELCEEFEFCGRIIAKRSAAKGGIRIGEGVKIIRGGFYFSCDPSNLTISPQTDTVLEIHDVPELAFRRMRREPWFLSGDGIANTIPTPITHTKPCVKATRRKKRA